MWPELTDIFLVVWIVFWIDILVLLGLIVLIDELHEMKREVKKLHNKK